MLKNKKAAAGLAAVVITLASVLPLASFVKGEETIAEDDVDSSIVETVSDNVVEEPVETVETQENETTESLSQKNTTVTTKKFVEKPEFENNLLPEITVETVESSPVTVKEEKVLENTVAEDDEKSSVSPLQISSISDYSMDDEGVCYVGKKLDLNRSDFKVKANGTSQAGIAKNGSSVYILFADDCTQMVCSLTIEDSDGNIVSFNY